MTGLPESRSRWMVAALCVIAALAGAVAWAARAAEVDRAAARDDVLAERDQVVAARARVAISASAFAQLTEELASTVDPAFDLGDVDHRVEIEREAEVLRTLLDDGRLETSAAPVGDLLDAVDRAIAPDSDVWALEEVAYIATTPSSAAADDSVAESSLVAAVLATSPSLVAIDGLTLELAASTAELPPVIADYVDVTVDIVETDPGWFGPDLRAPFIGGFLPGELLDETDPGLLRTLSGSDRLASVWAYDQWLIARVETPGPAPRPVLDLTTEAIAARDDMVVAVLERLDDEIAAQPVPAPRTFYTIVWIAAAVVAVTGAVAAVGLTVRRTRRLATAAFVDPLTGVGNRRALEAVEARWGSGSAPAHGVVAVLDVDRFKMINDTFGHAVGDDVLRRVAAELERVAAEVASRRGVGTVVRLGGDEFAIVWSLSEPCSDASVLAAVHEVSGSIQVGDDVEIDVSLSVGVVSAQQPRDLDGMLASADLRAYENKRRRRRDAVIVIDEPSAG